MLKKKVTDAFVSFELKQCSTYLEIAADKSNSNEIRFKALDSHPGCLANIGWNLGVGNRDSQRVLASAEANSELSKSARTLRPVSRVQFFPKEKDESSPYKRDVVVSYLERIGFDVQVSPPQVTGISTNAVFYSHDVSSEEIKSVAYALIRAGASIKVIHPGNVSYAKSKLIQVGADAAYDGKKALTIDEIAAANFRRDEKVVLTSDR